MGNNHSHTNLRSDCTGIEASKNASRVLLGDSISVAMCESADRSSEFPDWSMEYTIGEKSCGFHLTTHSSQGIELASQDSADNTIGLLVKLKRDGSGGLSCVFFCDGFGQVLTSTKANKDSVIETTTLSYGCSQREGLWVMEKRKNINYENAYLVTFAHYYVTQDVGLSVVAKVHNKRSNGSGVEVEGPYKHPAKDLRMVLVQTCRSRVWTPTACPHCCPTPQRWLNSGVPGFYLPFINLYPTNQSGNMADETMNYPSYYGSVGEQSNRDLINNSGNTNGNLNHNMIRVRAEHLHVWHLSDVDRRKRFHRLGKT